MSMPKQDTPQKPMPTLFEVFEKNLLQVNPGQETPHATEAIHREAFIRKTVLEYVSLLRRSNVVIPAPLEASVVEEWSEQVSQMLLKKTYGFSSISDYQHAQRVSDRSTGRMPLRRKPRQARS